MSDTSEIPDGLPCDMCDSDIPLEPNAKAGDVVYCSYCKVGLRIVLKANGRWSLEPEDEEG